MTETYYIQYRAGQVENIHPTLPTELIEGSKYTQVTADEVGPFRKDLLARLRFEQNVTR